MGGTVFTIPEVMRLSELGRFTLVTFQTTLDASLADTTRPGSKATTVSLTVADTEKIVTERYNWGATSLSDKVYYELHWERGVYCGSSIHESNLDNICTHLVVASFINILLWNISSPAQDVHVDFSCLVPESPIITDCGIKQIAEMKEGDRVLTHRGRFMPVIHTFERPYKGEVLDIRVNYAPTLTLTPEHPVLTTRGWVAAGRLSPGDYVKLSLPNGDEVQTLKVSDCIDTHDLVLHEGKLYATYDRGINPKANLLPNIITLSDDFLRIAGYYVAEGFPASHDTAVAFAFGERERDTLVKDVKDTLFTLFGLTASEYHDTANHAIRLTFGCAPLARLMLSLFGKGAHNKKLPEFAFRLSPSGTMSLLKGILRGDGGVHPNVTSTRVKFTTVSPHLASQVRLLLLKMGYTASVQGNGDSFVVYVDGNNELADEVFGHNYDRRWQRPHPHRGYLKNGTLTVPILSVEARPYNGYVHNLEVEGDNSYSTLGATLHNCWYYTYPRVNEQLIKDILFLPQENIRLILEELRTLNQSMRELLGKPGAAVPGPTAGGAPVRTTVRVL
jgi:hypothetical protein